MHRGEKNSPNERRWLAAAQGTSFVEAERPHMDRALKLLTGPQVLLVGSTLDTTKLEQLDFPHLVQVRHLTHKEITKLDNEGVGTQVFADPAFLPLDAGVFSSVILPHVLEVHELPHQVLREAHRVMRSDGQLILSGFNPLSIVGLQNAMRSKSVMSGSYYSFNRVRDWLRLLGFEITGSSMYQHSPICKTEGMRDATKFLNSLGDRWLPMTGGSYMITARKRDLGMTMVGPLRFTKKKRQPKLASASTSPAEEAGKL